MLTVALLVIYALLLPYCWSGFLGRTPGGPGCAVLDLAAVVLSGYALVLLYRPESNEYFRLITIARRMQ